MKRVLAMILSAAMLLSLAACQEKAPEKGREEVSVSPTEAVNEATGSKELTSSGKKYDMMTPGDSFNEAYNAFAFEVMRRAFTGESGEGNACVSPYSVYLALGMLYNGADGETADAMKELLGLPADQLNSYIAYIMNDKNPHLQIADSIWLRNDFADEVKQDFLDACANAYRASVFRTAMDGNSLEDINSWVSEKTKKRIPKLLNDVNPQMAMILINALTFDGEWEEYFSENLISKDFTHEDGTITSLDFMVGEEMETFYQTELCTGFRKFYQSSTSHSYSFIGLRPNDGVTVDELMGALTPEYFKELREGANRGMVTVRMPEFKGDTSVPMTRVLQEMGADILFAPDRADFSKIVDRSHPLWVSEVVHKTFVDVNRKGTKAAAATAIIMKDGCAIMDEEIPHYEVNLDRSFLYMIMDDSLGIPVFLGVMR